MAIGLLCHVGSDIGGADDFKCDLNCRCETRQLVENCMLELIVIFRSQTLALYLVVGS